MLLTSFFSILVLSSFKGISYTIINRIGILTILFSGIIFFYSYNLIALTPGMTLFNQFFYINSSHIMVVYIIIIITSIILLYNISNSFLTELLPSGHKSTSYIMRIWPKFRLHKKYHLYKHNTYPQTYEQSSTPSYKHHYTFFILFSMLNIVALILFPFVNNLISLYIIIELQSYSLYLITGIHNKSYNATKVALLYFIIGGVASSIILLASYYIYYTAGTTNLNDIYIYIQYSTGSIKYIFDILLIALFVKMGLAPFHRWSIAVYNYTPTYITAYISIVVKLSVISFIYTHTYLFGNYIIMVIFYVSIIIASYKPLYQTNIKIILAYSGILNFGYILLSIIANDVSFYFYILQYTITHIIIFMIIINISYRIWKRRIDVGIRRRDIIINPWSSVLEIGIFRGSNRYITLCVIAVMFSFIGIPPLPGFYGKYYIIQGALLDNYILEIIILIISSVVATYYYANIIKVSIIDLVKENKERIEEILSKRERRRRREIRVREDEVQNGSVTYILSVLTVVLISMYVYIPSILEGIYIISI